MQELIARDHVAAAGLEKGADPRSIRGDFEARLAGAGSAPEPVSTAGDKPGKPDPATWGINADSEEWTQHALNDHADLP